jgi:uncharacterized protein YbjT (DUF2867 family)
MVEIGGPTRLTYADMLLGYAKERGLKRVLIRTPFNAPRLSAYWVHMVTPIHWRLVLLMIARQADRPREAARKLLPTDPGRLTSNCRSSGAEPYPAR